MTVMKDGNDCQFYADIFPAEDSKFGQTVNPVTFSRRTLFGTDSGEPMLSLPLDVAKKMAESILKL